MRLLEALVRKDPRATEPHLQLIELLLRQGETARAGTHIALLGKSEHLGEDARSRLELLDIRAGYARGEHADALRQLDGFLARHPNHPQALRLQIRILTSAQQPDQAIRVIKKALRLRDSADLRLLQAQLLLKQGNIEGARLALLRMRELAPDDDTPVLMLSDMALKRNDADRAESLLREFLEQHPDALRVSNALGRLLVRQNRLVEAILVYRDMDQRTGGEPTVLQALGLLYYQHGDYREAAATFRKLMGIQPSSEASFYLAASLEALKQYDEAGAIYRRIGSDESMHLEAQLRLAGLEMLAGQTQKAARRLLAVIDKHPERLDAYSMLSSIRIAQKNYRKALEETEATMAIRRLPPQLLFNRAVAFDHFGQYDQVVDMLKRILNHDSRHSEALNFLAYTYAVRGERLDEAESLVRRALEQRPDDGYYLDTLAWVLYKKGEISEAIAIQKEALQHTRDDAVMHEHMGDMLWKEGRHDAARDQWRQALRLRHEQPDVIRKKIREGLE